MQSVLDSSYASTLKSRVQKLKPDSARRWGKMSIDQMLQHVNRGLEMALGRRTAAPAKTPLPPTLMRMIVLNMPWPKGAPTLPELLVTVPCSFEAEQTQCVRLIDEISAKTVKEPWPDHAAFGTMSGTQWSQLMAKHVDHHLKQFGN